MSDHEQLDLIPDDVEDIVDDPSVLTQGDLKELAKEERKKKATKASVQVQCQFPYRMDDSKDFQEKYVPVLITSVDHFREITDGLSYESSIDATHKNGKRLAGDTETDGVDHDQNRIVGFSFSTNPYDGYYVPIRHQGGGNLPEEEIFPLIRDFLYRNKWYFYHWTFDGLMFKREGIDISKIDVLDVRAFVYNADTNIKRNNLKWAAEFFCGRKSPTYEETVGSKDITFDMLTPQDAFNYACQDTANTYALAEFLKGPLSALCYNTVMLDCRLARAMAEYYLDNRLWIDKKEMSELAIQLREQRDKLEREILQMLGRTMCEPVNLNSNEQVAEALRAIGIDTGKETESGQMCVDKDVLSSMDHPVCSALVEHGHVTKQLTSYVDKLSRVDRGRINYKMYLVPTGRLASGGDEDDNPFYLPLNYQNLTKPTMTMYRKSFEGDDPSNPDLILGCRYTIPSKEEIGDIPPKELVEGPSPVLNIRRAISVPDGNKKEWYFVALDYSQEEVRIIGGLSRDPVYLKAFLEKEDIYRTVGGAMFGKDPKDITKAERKKAKIAVLGLNYGGSGYTLNRSSKIPIEECNEIAESYKKAVHVLEEWKRERLAMCQNERILEWTCQDDLERYSDRNIRRWKKAERNRCNYLVRTAYGRPRWLGNWIGSYDKKARAYGSRSVASHTVQGTAGDVMRIVLCELYDQIFSKYPDDIHFIGCVHDEINVVVRKESLELVQQIRKIMTITPPGCSCDLPVDVEFGYSYGYIFPFEQNEKGIWLPK